jgi:threonylcarbamoyladenosine tRNA methylthiotransferase MtaB
VPTFYVENFGCRATQADGAAIERQFRERGFEPAVSPRAAAIVVLNSCTVTAAADQDARAAIRRIRRHNPGCKIVVTGCYAQRAPEEVAALTGVSRVIGNSHKHRLAEIVVGPQFPVAPSETPLPPPFPVSPLVPLSALAGVRTSAGDSSPIFVSDIFAHTELLAAPVFEAAGQRTRPNLKVQDGCGNRCSFCVIPSVRGHSRSMPLERVLAEVNALVDAGYREVVISGINLGRWGRDLPVKMRFERLLRAILATSSLEKLRISSVEPMDWSGDLIQLVASSPRIAKHAHVPLQSGSDAVLRRMHRRYRPWHYREKIEQIHAAMPLAAIGADVMVGFPGETDAEFEHTRRMIEDLPFTYLHVFTYSPRPGTAAATRPQVPVPVARDRNRILRELSAEKKLAFMRRTIGQTIEAITLNSLPASQDLETGIPSSPNPGTRETSEAAFTEALTGNYLKLRLKGRHQPNRWITAKIERAEQGMLVGRVC